jgi:NADH-quinone oxidoreductase subunit E
MMNSGVGQQTKLLAALYLAQEQYGWLSPEAIQRVSARLNLQPGKVMSAASFYSLFKLKPQGIYVIQVCEGLSCYLVGGAEPLIEYLSERLGIPPGETSADGRFTLEVVQCLAACGSAPALRVNDDIYENMTLETIDELIEQLKMGGIGG